MDHIWLDRKGQSRPEDVPLFDKVQYDGEGLDDFLERLGLDIDSLENMLRHVRMAKNASHDDDTTELYVNSVVQEWLFIGAIIEFLSALGLGTDREQYLSDKGGAKCLSTSSLRSLVVVALSTAVNVDVSLYLAAEESQQLDYERLVYSRCVQEAEWARGLWAPKAKSHLETRTKDIIKTMKEFLLRNSPSITCLDVSTWTACSVLSDTFEAILDTFFGIFSDPLARPDPVNLWPALCRERGLCPSRMNKFYTGGSFTDAYIACSVLPERTQDHSACEPGKPCAAVSDMRPCPSHRSDCSGSCLMLGLKDSDKMTLEQALQDGVWAVVVFINDNPNSAAFTIESSTSHSTSFVALSHVWAHGLGNPEANAIWTCQLLHLKSLLLSMDCKHLAIWLDPLCVPLDSNLKMAAIARMDRIYATADTTLVLDHNLERQAGSRMHKRLQILVSDWMTRVWTLQEALLPRSKLHFAFKDGIHSVDDLLAHPLDVRTFDMPSAMIKSSCHVELRSNFQRGVNEHALLALLESFSRRTLTRSEDEPICLAILCNVPIAAMPSRPRIHEVFEHLPTLPQDIVFGGGSRSSAKHYGWLPKSFLDTGYYKAYLPRQTLVPHDSRGIRLEKDLARVEGSFWYDPIDQSASKPRHYAVFAHSSDVNPYRIILIRDDSAEIDEHVRSRQLESACLLFEKTQMDRVSPAILASDVALGADNTAHAKFVSHVWTVRFEHFLKIMPLEDHSVFPKLIAPLTTGEQAWLS